MKANLPQRSHEAGGLCSCTERGEAQAGLPAQNPGISVVILQLEHENYFHTSYHTIKLWKSCTCITTNSNIIQTNILLIKCKERRIQKSQVLFLLYKLHSICSIHNSKLRLEIFIAKGNEVAGSKKAKRYMLGTHQRVDA